MELLNDIAKELNYKIQDITKCLYKQYEGLKIINKVFDKENRDKYNKVIFYIDINLFKLNNPQLFEMLVIFKYIPNYSFNSPNFIYIVNNQHYIIFEKDENIHKSVFINFLNQNEESENICNICYEVNKKLISCLNCDFSTCSTCTDKLIENAVACPKCRM